jgi:hypothetical protein
MKRRTIMLAALKVIALTVVSVGAAGAKTSPATAVGSAVEIAGALQTSPILSTDLKAGWRLEAGGSLFSPLGAYRLTMQEDGNLVLYAIDDMKLPLDILHVLSGAPDILKLYTKPIWSTGTHLPKQGKSRGSYCVMEEDGNFVVYDRDKNPVFQTATGGHPGSYLQLQSEGNLVVYTPGRKGTWASNTAARLEGEDALRLQNLRAGPAVHVKNGMPAQLTMDLKPRWRLDPGDSLYSALGGFRLTMQGDGNLVLYQIDDMQIPGDVTPILLHTEGPQDLYHNAIWETGTNLPSQNAGTGAYCLMNADGNLVVYDEADRPCFQSGTKGHPGAFLRCQDDGNLVVYTRDNKAIWHSQTYSRIVNK